MQGLRKREIWYFVGSLLAGAYAVACFDYGRHDPGAAVAVCSVGLPFAVATFLFLRGLRVTEGATQRERLLGMAVVAVGLLLAMMIVVSAWGRFPGTRMLGVHAVHRTAHYRPGGSVRLLLSTAASSVVWTGALAFFLRSIGCAVRARQVLGFLVVLAGCAVLVGRASQGVLGKFNRDGNLMPETLLLVGLSAMCVIALRRRMETAGVRRSGPRVR